MMIGADAKRAASRQSRMAAGLSALTARMAYWRLRASWKRALAWRGERSIGEKEE